MGLKNDARLTNQTVARLRHAFRSAQQVLRPDSTPSAMPSSAASDLEAPLTDHEKEDLGSAWKKRYPFNIQSRLMGCDALVNRTYREWRRLTATVPEISKVKNQATMLRPAQEKREQLTREFFIIHHNATVAGIDNAISSIYDFYLGLRILMNVWAYIGNYDTNSSAKPGTKVRMIEYEQASNYADDVLHWTARSNVPVSQHVEWARDNDQLTRTAMMEKMRLGWPAGEALAHALDFHRQDWKPTKADRRRPRSFSRSPHHSRRKRDRYARSPESHARETPPTRGGRNPGGGVECVSMLKGGKQLCAAWNRGKCTEPCPRKQFHECNFRLPNGSACRKRHRRIAAHSR